MSFRNFRFSMAGSSKSRSGSSDSINPNSIRIPQNSSNAEAPGEFTNANSTQSMDSYFLRSRDVSFNVRKMLTAAKQSVDDDGSDQSSVVSAAQQSAKSTRRSSFGSLFSKRKKRDSVTLYSVCEEYSRILQNWSRNCEMNSIPLSRSVTLEFQKRIKQAEKNNGKSKLNLSNCSISDEQLIFFMEELSLKPVVAKLDLSGNPITNMGIAYVQKLQTCQYQFSTLIDPATRLVSTFLEEVLVNKIKGLDTKLLDEISGLSASLTLCNVQNTIHEHYLNSGSPLIVDGDLLKSFWTELIGKPGRRLQEACIACSVDPDGSFTYEEAEKVLLEGHLHKGLVTKLNESQASMMDGIKKSVSISESASYDEVPTIHNTMPSTPLHRQQQQQQPLPPPPPSPLSPHSPAQEQSPQQLQRAQQQQSQEKSPGLRSTSSVDTLGTELNVVEPFDVEGSSSFALPVPEENEVTLEPQSPSHVVPSAQKEEEEEEEEEEEQRRASSDNSESLRSTAAIPATAALRAGGSDGDGDEEESSRTGSGPGSGSGSEKLLAPTAVSHAISELTVNDDSQSERSRGESISSSKVLGGQESTHLAGADGATEGAGGEGKAKKIPAGTVMTHFEEDVLQQQQQQQHVGENENELFSVDRMYQSAKLTRNSISSNDLHSETSSVALSTPSASRKSMFFAPKKKRTRAESAVSIAEEFGRIFNAWSSRCVEKGIPLSKSVETEFQKRISQATAAKSKSKLRFVQCGITDAQLIILTEELAVKPVLSRLDLSQNAISTAGVSYIQKLQACQVELSTLLDPQMRLCATFLEEVVLNKSLGPIDQSLLDEVSTLSKSLALNNLQNAIYEVYLDKGAPTVVDDAGLVAMWTELLVKPGKKKIAQARAACQVDAIGALSYAECEAVLIEGHYQEKFLTRLDNKEEEALLSLKGRVSGVKSSACVSSAGGISAVTNDAEDGDEATGTGSSVDSSSPQQQQQSPPSHHHQHRSPPRDRTVAGTETGHGSSQSPNQRHAKKFSSAGGRTTATTGGGGSAGVGGIGAERGGENSPSIAIDDDDALEGGDLGDPLAIRLSDSENEWDDDMLSNIDPRFAIDLDDISDSEVFDTAKKEEEEEVPDVPPPKRTYRIRGIKRRKFTEDEVRKLSVLPQCRDVENLDTPPEKKEEAEEEVVETSGSNGDSAACEEMKEALDIRPSDYVHAPCNPPSPGAPSSPPSPFRWTVYDRSHCGLADAAPDVDFDQVFSSATQRFESVEVVLLRNNQLKNLAKLDLQGRFSNLSGLDLAHNQFTGALLPTMLPYSLLRIDISHNKLADIHGVMSCLQLEELNASHNNLETLHSLPQTLVRLDLSSNLIWSKESLRLFSLSPGLKSIDLRNNPVTLLVKHWRAAIRSVCPKIMCFDGRAIDSSAEMAAGDGGGGGRMNSSREVDGYWSHSSSRELSYNHHRPVDRSAISAASTTLAGMSGISTSSTIINRNIPWWNRKNESFVRKSTSASVPKSPEVQRRSDTERSEKHLSFLRRMDEQRSMHDEEMLVRATIVSPRRSGEEIGQLAERLSSPKHPTSLRKELKLRPKYPPTTFTTGRAPLQPDTVAKSASSSTAVAGKKQALAIPKWTSALASDSIKRWLRRASEAAGKADVLLQDLSDFAASEGVPVDEAFVEAFENSAAGLKLGQFDPLPLKMKLALNSLEEDHPLMQSVALLHQRLQLVASLIHQIVPVLTMFAGKNNKSEFVAAIEVLMQSDVKKAIDEFKRSTPRKMSPGRGDNEYRNRGTSDAASPSAEIPFATPTAPTSSKMSKKKEKRNPTPGSSSSSSSGMKRKLFTPLFANSHAFASESMDNHMISSATAQNMLSVWLAMAEESAARSVILFTDVFGFPEFVTGEDNQRFSSSVEFLALSRYLQFPRETKLSLGVLGEDHPLSDLVVKTQAKLINFHRIFSQIENAMSVCCRNSTPFAVAFDIICKSKLGKKVNQSLLESSKEPSSSYGSLPVPPFHDEARNHPGDNVGVGADEAPLSIVTTTSGSNSNGHDTGGVGDGGAEDPSRTVQETVEDTLPAATAHDTRIHSRPDAAIDDGLRTVDTSSPTIETPAIVAQVAAPSQPAEVAAEAEVVTVVLDAKDSIPEIHSNSAGHTEPTVVDESAASPGSPDTGMGTGISLNDDQLTVAALDLNRELLSMEEESAQRRNNSSSIEQEHPHQGVNEVMYVPGQEPTPQEGKTVNEELNVLVEEEQQQLRPDEGADAPVEVTAAEEVVEEEEEQRNEAEVVEEAEQEEGEEESSSNTGSLSMPVLVDWFTQCEVVSKRAARLLQMAADVASLAAEVTPDHAERFKIEHEELGLSGVEPPPKDVAAALLTLPESDVRLEKAAEIRNQLDVYDSFFYQIHHAMTTAAAALDEVNSDHEQEDEVDEEEEKESFSDLFDALRQSRLGQEVSSFSAQGTP